MTYSDREVYGTSGEPGVAMPRSERPSNRYPTMTLPVPRQQPRTIRDGTRVNTRYLDVTVVVSQQYTLNSITVART